MCDDYYEDLSYDDLRVLEERTENYGLWADTDGRVRVECRACGWDSEGLAYSGARIKDALDLAEKHRCSRAQKEPERVSIDPEVLRRMLISFHNTTSTGVTLEMTSTSGLPVEVVE